MKKKQCVIFSCAKAVWKSKTLLKMKLTTFILLIGIVQSFAIDGYAQKTRLNLKMENMSVRQVLNQIEDQSEFFFLYNSKLIDVNRKVDLMVEDGTIDQILNELFIGTHVGYQVIDRQIVLTNTKMNTSRNEFQQNTLQVTGTITDQAGNHLPGVTVVVRGTAQGTITDANGQYTLSNVAPNATLVFSFIGMKAQELPVSGRVKIDVTLSEETIGIDEVVAIGYGVVRKSDLTGSVSSIKSQDILAVPTTNAIETLQGRVSGIDIVKTSGQAGAGLSFTVRGERSLTASNAPLILVDGIPYGSRLDINPSDIESMEILKDASSTAIYGSKGANGVILITTKRGKAGKSMISVNSYMAVNSVSKYPHYMNGEEYAMLKREANRTTGRWSSLADDPKIFSPLELEYVNSGQWEDFPRLLLQNGVTQNYEALMTGGNEKTTYSLSFGYMDEIGLFKVNDQFQRYNGRITLDHQVFNNLKIGANVLYTYRDQASRRDPLNMANKIVPIAKAYDDDGSVNPYPSPGYSSQMNPLVDDVEGAAIDNTINKRIFATSYIDWQILKKLTFKTNIGLDLTDQRRGYFYNRMTLDGGGNFSSSGAELTTSKSLTWDNVLNYNIVISTFHDFQFMIGTSLSTNDYEFYTLNGRNQSSPFTLYHFLESNSQEIRIGSDYAQTNTFSYFGRLNYKYKDRYLLTASLRSDGSSVLAPGNKWAAYPSVALAWRISEEEFVDDLDAITNLKLRLSWGKSGSSAIDPYYTLGGLGSSQYSFNNTLALGYYPKIVPNPSLGWEATSVYNIGLDLGFFDNRISATIDVFKSYTSDLLLSRSLPMTSGYNNVVENIGKTENQGLDFSLSTVNVRKHYFSWNTDINYSFSKEKITALSSGVSEDVNNRWFVGSPIRVLYDYKKIGIWQLGEETEAAKFGTIPGEIKVADMNSDGKIDIEDRVKFKQRPDFTLGINNSFRYKNIDFSFFTYARIGHYINYSFNTAYKAQGLENGSFVNYWTPENPSNDFPRPNAGVAQGSRNYFSTLGIVKGSFVKVRDITLGYNLPSQTVNRLGINNLRIYATGKNLITFSQLKDYDPERGGGESFPMTKQIVFGINLCF